MNSVMLQESAARLGLTKLQLAQLLDVTIRAVNLWMSGERAVPGPVVAYMRVLEKAADTVLAQELARISNKDPDMYEGMYSVSYEGNRGVGAGVLVLQGGMAYGTDLGGVVYDGKYAPSPDRDGFLDVQVTASVPPGVPLVMLPARPTRYSFDIQFSLAIRQNQEFVVQLFGMPVKVKLTHLRDLPKAA